MASFVGHRVAAPPVPVKRQPLHVPPVAQVLWWVMLLVVKTVIVIVRSPVALAVVVLVVLEVLASRVFGFAGVLGASVWLGALGLVVFLVCVPARTVARSRWRRFSNYRHRWPATMNLAELDRTRSNGTQYRPVLGKVISTKSVDTVRARMLAGQVVDDWGKVSDRLCQTFGAEACRVRSVPGRPHEVELSFLMDDPLTQVIEPVVTAVTTLDALPVGIQEDGQPYRLPLLGSHVLLVGATGAGKSSVIWSIVDQLAPGVADGTVQLWGIDPKAMELAAGEPLFARMAYRDPADYADLLEDAVLVMHERQASLRGVTRLHTPSRDEPLIVILIDELAALAYTNDRDVRRRTENALGLLLSQGRAVGVSVVGAIQDPRKEVLPARDLFPVRVALRLTEAQQVPLVLGQRARDRGAHCEEIPYSLPGVGFVEVDGVAEPARVRFAHVTDDHIRALVRARTRPVSLSLVPDVHDVVHAAPEAA